MIWKSIFKINSAHTLSSELEDGGLQVLGSHQREHMNELQQKYFFKKRNTKKLVIFKYQLSATCYQLCIRGNSQGRELQLHPLILPLQADSQLM